MSSRICVGIDPGVSGGLVALWSDSRGEFGIYSMLAMPDNDRAILNWFLDLGARSVTTAVLEKIPAGGFQGSGKSSVTKIYGSYRCLRMALTASGIRFQEKVTRSWARGLGIRPREPSESRSQWKGFLKSQAQKLFPYERGITLKTCDAVLIADYCRRLGGEAIGNRRAAV